MIVVELYVDDIIFGSNDDILSQKFALNMQKQFELSMLRELSFFLWLQISQLKKWYFHLSNQVCERNVENI